MVFGTNFSDATDLENETLGLAGTASATFDASVDTVHVTGGVSAADLDVYGSAVAGGGSAPVSLQLANGSNDVTLTGWDASAAGIRNSNVLSFDDGSVLRTNATSNAATLSGGAGDDLLVAGSGGGILAGNAGDDRLIGGSGSDQIYGGNGADTIYGGNGADYLSGGVGADVFVFNGTAGDHDTVSDYVDGTDSFLVDTADAADFASLTVTDSNGDALITFASGATIRLLGVANTDIDLTDFTFSAGSFHAAGTDVFA
jgi:Ca2+-binding RTX toxin-like protein